jgi:hypothetical protein
MRRSAKVDANQKAVVKSLRGIPGVTVAITSSLGEGFPDFIVGYKGFNYMIELKDGNKPPSARKLTDDEIEFKQKWKGQYTVCNSFDEIFKLITTHCEYFYLTLDPTQSETMSLRSTARKATR